MKITEKLKYIQDNHFEEWLKTRREVENEESNRHLIFCVCGKLATGLHESHCQKFRNSITRITLDRLKHLLPK